MIIVVLAVGLSARLVCLDLSDLFSSSYSIGNIRNDNKEGCLFQITAYTSAHSSEGDVKDMRWHRKQNATEIYIHVTRDEYSSKK